MNRTQIVAHRGQGLGVRENTLAAVRGVLAEGLGLEIDVHLTRDGAVIMHHDHRLHRAHTRRVGTHAPLGDVPPLEQMTLADLAEWEVQDRPGRWNPVARLDEVLDLWTSAGDPPPLMIEMKTSPEYEETRTDPRPLAEAVLELVRRRDLLGAAMVKGFDWRGVVHARALEPRLRTLCLSFPMGEIPDGAPPPVRAMLERVRADRSIWAGEHDPDRLGITLPGAIAAAGAWGWSAHHGDLDQTLVDEAHALGLTVAAWTVNEPGDMARMIDLGVDLLVTDHPAEALALLEARR